MFEYFINTWWAIPLLIFFARILDVSIGTIRLIFVSKGLKYYAPIFGFFEVLIWLVAVKKVLSDLTNPLTYIAYALGFSTGIFIGIIVEEKIIKGKSLIRVITKNPFELRDKLNEKHYRFTIVNAKSETGPVKILFIITAKKRLEKTISLIKEIIPSAYYTIENINYARDAEEIIEHKHKSIFSKFSFFKKK